MLFIVTVFLDLVNGVDVPNSLHVGIHGAHDVMMLNARIMLMLNICVSASMKMPAMSSLLR